MFNTGQWYRDEKVNGWTVAHNPGHVTGLLSTTEKRGTLPPGEP